MRLRTRLRWFGASTAACLVAASLIGPVASAATVQGPIGCSVLAFGDSGTPVRVLQGDLHQLGLYQGAIDGVFGGTTWQAVTLFQRQHGLTVNGQLDATTLNAIAAAMGLGPMSPHCGGAATGASTGAMGATHTVAGPIGCVALQEGDAGLPVRVLQGDLHQLGYFTGAITGVFGASTQGALAALQQAHGLPATGVLDGATLNAIGGAMGLGDVTPRCGTGTTDGGTGGGSTGASGATGTGSTSSGHASGGQTFVQGTASPAVSGGLQVGGQIDGLTIVRVIHLTATAYGATAQDNYPYGAVDAFGLPLKPGDVAVDPAVISLNTKMYVTGYHTPYLPQGGELAVARDTGGAIQGARIDMYINSTNESLISSFGIQSVTAYILS